MKPILNFVTHVLITGVIIFVSCKKEKSCEGCATNSTSHTNKPPISIAGPDQVIALPTDSILLDGSNSSDPDGMISEWLWTKISGPASFTINNPSATRTVVKNLTAGVYKFELKVTDNGGLSAKDTVQVMVDDPAVNQPPVANAGPDQIITLPTNTVTLNGNASTDPDNNIASYVWTKISGPSAFDITNSNAVQTQVTNLVQGVYQFELKVADAGGLFSKDTMQVTVNTLPPPQPTGANAGVDIIITLPLDSLYLNGSVLGNQASFQWTKISGPSGIAIFNYNTYWGTVLVKNLTPGLYSFRFEASDGVNTSADTMTVLVINDPQDLNTITFKNLKWRLADEYGTGIIDLDIVTPSQPNLFIAWDQLRPVEIYLQTDSISQWFIVPTTQSGFLYAYDAASPHIWIARIPPDSSWVGKESSIKVKLL